MDINCFFVFILRKNIMIIVKTIKKKEKIGRNDIFDETITLKEHRRRGRSSKRQTFWAMRHPGYSMHKSEKKIGRSRHTFTVHVRMSLYIILPTL